jgi:hypothetical protein
MSIQTEKGNMPFKIRDCTIITRMGGVDTAVNLRELRERIARCSVEVLFHHFCETHIRPTFDDPEFRNDFAIWAARQLRDRVLAERLGVINPYTFSNMEELREHVLDTLDERLSEVGFNQWVQPGRDFRFMRAATVIFETGLELLKPEDLVLAVPHISTSSVYFHFIEARRRTENYTDDFSLWLEGFGRGVEPMIESLRSIDFYFLTLPEIKESLIAALNRSVKEVSGAANA